MYKRQALLRSALVPVEPSEGLSDRLERGLSELTDLAAEELADWELSAMRDPRNWARPVGAAAVLVTAAAGLFVVRMRQRQKGRKARRLGGVERSMRDAAEDVRRRLPR